VNEVSFEYEPDEPAASGGAAESGKRDGQDERPR
jgi:hypothetical protein